MSASSDPYVYPGTAVLKNLRDIRDPDMLAVFEARVTGHRLAELEMQPLEGRFDSAHLKAIHKHIFQDVYSWAGKFRTTILGKAEFIGGPVTYFTAPHLLELEAQRIFRALRRANLLQNLSRAEFAKQAAQLLVALNSLHPYREGNGRAQRAFLQAVARQAGHPLYFDVISKERMVQACILSGKGDSSMMTRLFQEITDADRIQPLRRAIEFLASRRFNWNDAYLATTTPGQHYAGKLVGRDREAFMMRTDSDQIIIGRQRDISPDIRPGEHFSFTAQGPAKSNLGSVGRVAVARDAVAYMQRSKTAIADMPITERSAPRSGSVTGTAVAVNDTHVAIATAANTFVVIERATISGDIEVGKRVRLRFSRGYASVERAHDRGR